MFCYVESGNLVAFADTDPCSVFSLANPAQPQLINQSPLNRQFISALAHRGNTAFATLRFHPLQRFLISQPERRLHFSGRLQSGECAHLERVVGQYRATLAAAPIFSSILFR